MAMEINGFCTKSSAQNPVYTFEPIEDHTYKFKCILRLPAFADAEGLGYVEQSFDSVGSKKKEAKQVAAGKALSFLRGTAVFKKYMRPVCDKSSLTNAWGTLKHLLLTENVSKLVDVRSNVIMAIQYFDGWIPLAALVLHAQFRKGIRKSGANDAERIANLAADLRRTRDEAPEGLLLSDDGFSVKVGYSDVDDCARHLNKGFLELGLGDAGTALDVGIRDAVPRPAHVTHVVVPADCSQPMYEVRTPASGHLRSCIAAALGVPQPHVVRVGYRHCHVLRNSGTAVMDEVRKAEGRPAGSPTSGRSKRQCSGADDGDASSDGRPGTVSRHDGRDEQLGEGDDNESESFSRASSTKRSNGLHTCLRQQHRLADCYAIAPGGAPQAPNIRGSLLAGTATWGDMVVSNVRFTRVFENTSAPHYNDVRVTISPLIELWFQDMRLHDLWPVIGQVWPRRADQLSLATRLPRVYHHRQWSYNAPTKRLQWFEATIPGMTVQEDLCTLASLCPDGLEAPQGVPADSTRPAALEIVCASDGNATSAELCSGAACQSAQTAAMNSTGAPADGGSAAVPSAAGGDPDGLLQCGANGVHGVLHARGAGGAQSGTAASGQGRDGAAEPMLRGLANGSGASVAKGSLCRLRLEVGGASFWTATRAGATEAAAREAAALAALCRLEHLLVEAFTGAAPKPEAAAEEQLGEQLTWLEPGTQGPLLEDGHVLSRKGTVSVLCDVAGAPVQLEQLSLAGVLGSGQYPPCTEAAMRQLRPGAVAVFHTTIPCCGYDPSGRAERMPVQVQLAMSGRIPSFNGGTGQGGQGRKRVFSPPLAVQRHRLIAQVLAESHVQTALDFGCGEAAFIRTALLLPEPALTAVAGVDVSVRALNRAGRIIPWTVMKRRDESALRDLPVPSIQLFEGSVMEGALLEAEPWGRWRGCDAAVACEVIEHVHDTETFTRTLLGTVRPRVAVVSTPNSEYNRVIRHFTAEDWSRPIGADGHPMRDADHKFEWTRKEFADWAGRAAALYGYSVSLQQVGRAAEHDDWLREGDAEGPTCDVGLATQVAVFHCLANPAVPGEGDMRVKKLFDSVSMSQEDLQRCATEYERAVWRSKQQAGESCRVDDIMNTFRSVGMREAGRCGDGDEGGALEQADHID